MINSIFLLVLILISPCLYAMRPIEIKHIGTKTEILMSLKSREEIRSKNLSLLEINFNETVKYNLVAYFKKLGYSIQRFDLQENKPKDLETKFDLIFLNAYDSNDNDIRVYNLLHVLRDDGILFVKTNSIKDSLYIANAAMNVGYDIHVTENLCVIKRHFNNFKVFESIATDIKVILASERSA